MSTSEFPKRDPAEAGFWDLRYQADFIPWDAGRAPKNLREWIAASPARRSVLVPGCGSAWDVRFLAEAGWDVLGLDFSPAAVAAAREVLGPHAGRARQGDVFAPIAEAPFDGVYERAFLCALPPRMRQAWGVRMAELVRPGGELAGYFFFGDAERGPPFPLGGQAELDGLLTGAFTREEDAAVADSIEVFAGRERWQVWRRRT